MSTDKGFIQVGGHSSTITVSPCSNGSILNKPSSKQELDFYTKIGPSLLDSFIGEWTPEFYGVLQLQGQLNQDGQLQQPATSTQDRDQVNGQPDEIEEIESAAKELLVLENITYRFLQPNVLDIKLGTQLYDEETASAEKRERMIKTAKETTSFESGIRLTGFQVWDASTKSYLLTPKEYGKTISSSHLLSGIAKFFYPPLEQNLLPEELSSQSSSATPPKPAAVPTPLPLELLLPVLEGISLRLQQLEEVVTTLPIRMRGASILLVIEGDAEALREATKRSQMESSENGEKTERSARIKSRPTTTTDSDEENAIEEDDEEGSDTSSVSTTDHEGNAKPFTRLAWDLRLIDFAHTRLVRSRKVAESNRSGEIRKSEHEEEEEDGPDQGVLKGIRTTRRLVRELIDELEKETGENL